MIAISNSGLANLGKPPVNLSLMTPVFTWSANYGTGEITITSATTVTSPETYKHANIRITDDNGYSIYGEITTRTGNTGALDFSRLKQTGDLHIEVTCLSTFGIIACGVGNANSIATTGTVGDYATYFTTAAGI